MVEMDTLARKIRLPGGRYLGYFEYGDPNGYPIFHFHGFPGSRLEGALFAEAARSKGILLIAVDRPGMGLSDFQPDRAVLDWPADVAMLADHLGIQNFGVEGFSGGSQYACACAYALPYRVTTCSLVSGAGPADPSSLDLTTPHAAAMVELGCQHAADQWARDYKDATSADASLARTWSKVFPGHPDAKLKEIAWVRHIFAVNFSEAFRQGSQGEGRDGILRVIPWGFGPEDLSPDIPVFLWHGEQDGNVPASVARSVASTIPHCKARFFPSEGHVSLVVHHAPEFFQVLVNR
ncbi:MAG TPA: alpha/beta hydrolase [Candidatus Lokiarchaeia archaeon]|nr:alpha/beta hydrolase [Candidatus Lokiarchaeia archaeon]